MDTSKQYIEMCDCLQIQGRWTNDTVVKGDWFFNKGDKKTHIVDHLLIRPFLLSRWHGVWLPRLDQLLEMIPYVKNIEWDVHRDYLPEEGYMCNKYDTRKDIGTGLTSFYGDTPEQAVLQGVIHEMLGGPAEDIDK